MLRSIALVVARAPGVVVLEVDGDRALWSSAKARKEAVCALTGRPIAKGEVCYRPIGNQLYRYERIREDALHRVIEEMGGFESQEATDAQD